MVTKSMINVKIKQFQLLLAAIAAGIILSTLYRRKKKKKKEVKVGGRDSSQN